MASGRVPKTMRILLRVAVIVLTYFDIAQALFGNHCQG